MKQPAYYISVYEKKPKKKTLYSHAKYVGDNVHFINLDNKEELIITKRELMLNLQADKGWDIGVELSNLK